jgi:hypothetical protein
MEYCRDMTVARRPAFARDPATAAYYDQCAAEYDEWYLGRQVRFKEQAGLERRGRQLGRAGAGTPGGARWISPAAAGS